MNVLFLSVYDYSSVASRLSMAINKYTHWSANVITHSKIPYPIKNPNVITATEQNQRTMQKIMKHADVVIWTSSFYEFIPDNTAINPNAKLGIWHGGTRYRTTFQYYNRQIHPNLDYVFAHRDLEELDNDIIRLHAPFDTQAYIPIDRTGDIIVSHSPSSRNMKGTDDFVSAMDRIEDKYNNVKMILIENMDNKKSLKIKRQSSIFFDQMNGYSIPTGATCGYGVSLIEAASFGCAVMGWSDYKDTPIICVRSEEDIYNNISILLNNRTLLDITMKKTREWVVKEHDYSVVAEKFISVLEEHL